MANILKKTCNELSELYSKTVQQQINNKRKNVSLHLIENKCYVENIDC